jgi:hypothetical protein
MTQQHCAQSPVKGVGELPSSSSEQSNAAAVPAHTPHVYRTGSGWGDACYFFDYDTRRVSGHKQRIPHVGDLLESPMQSGRIGVYRFTQVERVGDPPDMFFATVKDIGFKDEIDAARAALSAANPEQV